MKKTNIIPKLLGLCLIIFTAVSCVNDYFVDETNFYMFVPQMGKGEVSNVYIAIHTEGGEHVITRKLKAPFTDNQYMKDGKVKFKLPVGNMRVSVFAEYTEESITEGYNIAESQKVQFASYDRENYYISSATAPRALFKDVKTLPFGHPDCKIPVEFDLDEDQRFKGQVVCKFIELPTDAGVDKIEISYVGLATRYGFDGIFKCFSDTDCLYTTFDTESCLDQSTNTVVCSDLIYPSRGTSFMADASYTDNPQEFEVVAKFYSGVDLIGEAVMNTEMLAQLSNDKKPTVNGTIVNKLILHPQETMTLTFKGFQIFKMELEGWGDVEQGGTTPM